jgi:hypothetical protein
MFHQSQNELLPENLRDFVLGQLEVPKLCLLLRIQRYQTKEHSEPTVAYCTICYSTILQDKDQEPLGKLGARRFGSLERTSYYGFH